MAMNLQPRSERHDFASDQSWLGSAHGTTEADSVSLDGDAFFDAFRETYGRRVPSGVVMSEGEDGLYVPGAGGGGRVGFLFTDAILSPDDAGDVGPVPVALFWHGQVIVNNLPDGHGLDTAGAEGMPLIHFVGEVPAAG